MVEPRWLGDLLPIQKTVLRKLAATLKALLPPKSNPEDERSTAGRARENSPRNVTGVFGERGTGKSTVLSALYAASLDLGEEKFADCAGIEGLRSLFSSRVSGDERVLVLRPLDCSVFHPDTPASAALLLHLLHDPRLFPRSTSNEGDRLKRAFRQLAGVLARSPGFYNAVVAEASTPDDAQEMQLSAISDRLSVRDQLREQLDLLCERCRVKAFVVLLDDFDLIDERDTRQWLQALTDELNQPRLLFVLAADFHRLEYLSFNGDRGIDEQTGRALVAKLLGGRHRVELLALSQAERSATLNELLQKGHGHRDSAWTDIWARAVDPQHAAVLRRLAPSLLPYRVRGLVHLAEVIDSTRLESERSTADPSPERSATGPSDRLAPISVPPAAESPVGAFLRGLAASRGESRLARRLIEVTPAEWVAEMRWPTESDPALWRQSEKTLRNRIGSAATEPEALPILGVIARRPWLRGVGNDTTRDPRWPSPLRHESLNSQPLRDARVSDHPLWTEFLIDLSFAESSANVARFVDQWPPVRDRVSAACFRVAIPSSEIAIEITLNPGAWLGYLPWIDASPADAVNVGCGPLWAWSAGRRSMWPSEFLERQLFSREDLVAQGADPMARSVPLPQTFAELFLLVDAFGRVPWRQLSGESRDMSLREWVRLSVAFVAASYLHAANLAADRCGLLKRFVEQLQRDDLIADDGLTIAESHRRWLAELERPWDIDPPEGSDVAGLRAAFLDFVRDFARPIGMGGS